MIGRTMSLSPSPEPIPAAARLFRAASIVLPVALILLLLACNAIHLRHQSLRRDFTRAGMRERTVELESDRLHYWRSTAQGDHPPVLLLHGFGGAAVWQWAEQVPALAPNRTVLVPDLLWFGGSSSTDADPRLDHQVAAMVALLDHEGLVEVDVVGISYGGLVGWRLAQLHGERVRRLVLVDSPGPAHTPDDRAAMLRRFGVDDVVELIVPQDLAAVRRLLEVAYHDPPAPPDFALRQVKELLYDPYREPQTKLLRALTEGETLGATIEPVDAAVGLIWGDDDQVFPLEIALRLSTALAAPLHVIPHARHAPNLEHPERFNEALLDLLDAPG
ncbi:MAG: alpha/beta hydrolase [Myxococcales bacterium]|nr:alpha/beta hydrolase [Myxococcales bacterium]